MAIILIVEDNDDISEMEEMYLMMDDHTVHRAVNGKDGVAQALKLLPDIVIMDMHMHIMDGHTAVRALRDLNYTGKIIAVTASATKMDADNAILSGCDGFISKPIGGDFSTKVVEYL